MAAIATPKAAGVNFTPAPVSASAPSAGASAPGGPVIESRPTSSPVAASAPRAGASAPGGPITASRLTSGFDAVERAQLLRMLARVPIDQLGALFEQAQNERETLNQELRDTYGTWFCDLVGIDELAALPPIGAAELGLGDADLSKYPFARLDHVMPRLGGSFAYRGIMGVQYPRPFVAVTVEVLDGSGQVKHQVLEVIFKRYALNGDGGQGKVYGNNYVTANNLYSLRGERWSSSFYSSGGMIPDQVTALKNVLKGQTIKAPVGDYFIRKA